jgi:hypothetical protein
MVLVGRIDKITVISVVSLLILLHPILAILYSLKKADSPSIFVYLFVVRS